MMHCQICERDVQPAIDINEAGRALSVCPKCTTVLGTGDDATDRPTPPTEPASAVGRIDTPSGPRKVSGAPLDLIAETKTRLAAIDAELARFAGLQRERRKLAAMVAAAEAVDADDFDVEQFSSPSTPPGPPVVSTLPLFHAAE